ncbi:hypothetical protein [Ferrimicrobium acidiphilum]|nr:hypothetical protein [Ferrimicrobium acidiphilum]
MRIGIVSLFMHSVWMSPFFVAKIAIALGKWSASGVDTRSAARLDVVADGEAKGYRRSIASQPKEWRDMFKCGILDLVGSYRLSLSGSVTQVANPFKRCSIAGAAGALLICSRGWR